MKLNYTTKNGRINVGFEGEGQRQVWEQLADFQEVFEEAVCGKCGSENLRFVVRDVEDNKYYELRCLERNCNSRLSFGCNKNGKSLFPKRKDDTGKYKGDNGWTKWDKTANEGKGGEV